MTARAFYFQKINPDMTMNRKRHEAIMRLLDEFGDMVFEAEIKCECGWFGKIDELVTHKPDAENKCPNCNSGVASLTERK